MRKQEYLINLNHNSSANSFRNYSSLCDGFFVSSCNTKKDKLFKLLKANQIESKVFIDFFHYVSTIELTKNSSDRFKNELESRLIKEISINKNLVSLILLKKESEAEELIKNSISNWINFINSHVNNSSNFIFSIPFPMIGSGSIYKKIIEIYSNELIKNIDELKKINKFIHIVLRAGNRVDNDILSLINNLINKLNINDIIVSFWRNDDVLLTNIEEIKKIQKTVLNFINLSKNIYINYLHNEFLIMSNLFKNKVNYIFGTFEQTKVLSPKIRWMHEEDNFQRFDNKIYLEKYGINVKLKRLAELMEFDLDKYITKDVLNFKNTESFKFNFINMKNSLNSSQISLDKIINNIYKILNDPYFKNLFNKTTKYSIESYLDMYQECSKLFKSE